MKSHQQEGTVSPTNMSFESANHITTDQWQNMRENGSNFGKSGQFLGNILNTYQVSRLLQISQEPAQNQSW